MTSLTMPALEAVAVLAAVRPPDRNIGLPSATERTLEWDTDLSAEELQTVSDVRAVTRGIRPMTAGEYAIVRAQMQTLRDLRQMGRATFMALTAAERDRLMYDAHTATTIVLLAILRD